MRGTFICDGIRTPIGRYGGALVGVRADGLAAIPLRKLLSRNPHLGPSTIDDVIFGCANQAGEDNRNVARMATLLADYSYNVAGITINHLCGSGFDAIGLAARTIKASDADLLTAGGAEPMSRVPFVMGRATAPFQYQVEMFDTTIGRRFVSPLIQQQFGADSMPEATENVVELLNMSQGDQDVFAYRSQQYTAKVQCDSILTQEIMPVQVIGRKGTVSAVREDERPRVETMLEQLVQSKTSFHKNDMVTTDNISRVNDGTATMIVTSEQYIKAQGLMPRARTVVMATVGVEPKYMGLGSIPAVRKAPEHAGLDIGDMDVAELNEAFTVQALGMMRQFGLADDAEHMNPNGGTVILGRPLGMSDVRPVLAATLELERHDGRHALCTICIGVGQGIAMIPE